MTRKKALRIMASLLGIAALAGALWWGLFGLKPYDPSPAELQARHEIPPGTEAPQVQLGELETLPGGQRSQSLRFRSFDGAEAVGRIVYPAAAQGPAPLLINLHALGRAHQRMFQAEFKGRPTMEQTHRVTELALSRGYAVVALDAREHGERAMPGRKASDLLRELHWWGRRDPYERMLVDTIKDYRVLLDWATRQPHINAQHIRATGYSMGAQMALLLGALDPRVEAVAAIVPPHVGDKVAVVNPHRLMAGLAGKQVWLLSADDDEYASKAQNQALFEAIPAQDKHHLRFPGGHLLPANYIDGLSGWF